MSCFLLNRLENSAYLKVSMEYSWTGQGQMYDSDNDSTIRMTLIIASLIAFQFSLGRWAKASYAHSLIYC